MMDTRRKDDLVFLGMAGWSEEAIRVHVEQLCYSEGFDDGEQARHLLDYLVKEALAGREPQKADIAVVVLGKRDFHPHDTSVRVATDRLRKRMEHYYKKHHKAGEIRLEIPPKTYKVLAPRNMKRWLSPDTLPNAAILEPAEQAEVYKIATVRGRIDSLDPDLRVWLVVFARDKVYYPQCRVSRSSPTWQYEVRIGTLPWGESDGYEFSILLVAADVDADYDFQGYVRRCGDGFGKRLPVDTEVLDSKRIIRRDIRPD